MTISKLGNTSPAPLQDRATSTGSKSKAGGAGATQAKSADVRLSPLSEKLKTLAQDAAASGSFDEKKVNQIKDAIAKGTFKVNAEAVADKMIAEAKELAGKKA